MPLRWPSKQKFNDLPEVPVLPDGRLPAHSGRTRGTPNYRQHAAKPLKRPLFLFDFNG
jgi:hypothetical protein